MVDAREKYIASLAPRRKRTHPARSAQALNTSGAGIVHRQMMDLQRQPNLNKADTSRLKDLRRDWNRNRKYTDAGMKISGASSPLDAQKYFVDTTRDFRDTNRDAYASMYPLTNLAMEYPQKGGLLGMFLSDIGGKTLDKVKDFGSSLKEGITSALDDTPDEQADYAAKTFGFYPSDVHPGLPVEDDRFVAPPDDIIQTDPSADIIESDLPVEPMPSPDYLDPEYFNWVDQFYDTHNPDGTPKSEPRVIPGRPITPLQEEVVVPDEPLPFNDARREAGIMSQHGQGPMWGSTEGTLRNQYLEHMKRGGEKMTYEEFERAWERMHALPRGLHFQEPRVGIR